MQAIFLSAPSSIRWVRQLCEPLSCNPPGSDRCGLPERGFWIALPRGLLTPFFFAPSPYLGLSPAPLIQGLSRLEGPTS